MKRLLNTLLLCGIVGVCAGQKDTTCSCSKVGMVKCVRIGECPWPPSGNTSTTTFSIECVIKDRPPKPHNKFKEVARRVHYVKP